MRVISPVPAEKWEDIVRRSDESTFFHTPAWAEILEHAYGYETASRLFVFDDGTEILLPLLKTHESIGLFSEYKSMPEGTYGGFLCAVEPNRQKIDQALKTFGPWDSLEICPPPLSKHAHMLTHSRASSLYTHILRLDGGFDAVWTNSFSSKLRNVCRRAQKAGCEVSSTADLVDFESFNEIYQHVAPQRDEATYPRAFFQAMAGRESVRLWLARYDGKIAGGIIAFYGPKEAFYQAAAVLPEYVKHGTNSFLLQRLIEDASLRGLDYVNFGSSVTAGRELEALKRFKASFGAEKVVYNRYRRDGILFRTARSTRRLIVRRRI